MGEDTYGAFDQGRAELALDERRGILEEAWHCCGFSRVVEAVLWTGRLSRQPDTLYVLRDEHVLGIIFSFSSERYANATSVIQVYIV